jgi:hypothetical protein
MNTGSLRLAALLLSSVLLSGSAGCPPGPLVKDSATLVYDQVGACNGYQQTSGPGGAGPINTVSAGVGAAFVVFRVVEIDNSKSSEDFNFVPDRLFVNGTSPRAFMSSSLSFARDLGVLTAVPATIPKGKKVGINGLVVAVVPVAQAPEANNTSYMLSYETQAADPGVFLAKRNLSQTTWPQTNDCRSIHF